MIYLASNSPRRRELVKKITNNYTVVTLQTEEKSQESGLKSKEIALYNAKIKAEAVYNIKGGFVVGADTVVDLDNTVLGKPVDEKDARNMLKLLSGKTHRVITAVCVMANNKTFLQSCTSYVTFNDLSEDFISEYIKSGQAFDKAGSYGIQDSVMFVKKLSGSKINVIGFPVRVVKKLLIKAGYCF